MKPEDVLINLSQLSRGEINLCAYETLNELLERCTINLVARLTSITRKTLYRWLDPDRSLEEMDHKIAVYFLTLFVYDKKIQLLMTRPPLSHRRLAGRLLEEGQDNAKD